jgi:hypothetical protein
MMNDNERAAREWDRALEHLAADVTNTAYAIALRHGAGASWVDLELGLWEALLGLFANAPAAPAPRRSVFQR